MVNICPKPAQDLDEQYTKYWTAGICGLIGVCVVVHWMSVIMRHTSLQFSMASVHKPLTRFSRGFRLMRGTFLPGRFLLAIAYIAINLVIMFTNIDWKADNAEQVYAMRCGWLTLCNLVLTIFLGLKNTPLSPIAGQSYDILNVLHRACGYTTIVCMILHSTNMVAYLFSVGYQHYLNLPGQHAAAVAGFSFLAIAATANHLVRKRWYEVFYLAHIALVIMVLIAAFIHVSQIDWAAKTFPIVGACLWGADRLVRWSKWFFYSHDNECTLVALPEGATKVIMKRAIHGRPASHAFLAIPRIRPFQTHPFTLACSDPATFVIGAHNGFTKSLHHFATMHPNRTLRAGIEGPYGHVPSVERFDRVVLVGGGSGATFTVALAMDWLRRTADKEAGSTHSLDFIWAIKTRDYLTWFEKELLALNNSPHVRVSIYVTAKGAAAAASEEGSSASDADISPVHSISKELSKGTHDAIHYGRPDIKTVLAAAIADLNGRQRVLVAGSGPAGLLTSARIATKSLTTTKAPNIELHLEEFDW